MSEKFDWNTQDNEDIAIQPVQAIAVYMNIREEIVIRQQCGQLEEVDHLVSFPLIHASQIIEAIKKLM